MDMIMYFLYAYMARNDTRERVKGIQCTCQQQMEF